MAESIGLVDSNVTLVGITPLEDDSADTVHRAIDVPQEVKFPEQKFFTAVNLYHSDEYIVFQTKNKKIGPRKLLLEDLLGIIIRSVSPQPKSILAEVHHVAFKNSDSRRRHERIEIIFSNPEQKEVQDKEEASLLKKVKQWRIDLLQLCDKCIKKTFIYDCPWLHKKREATDMEANPLAKYYLVFINPCSGKGQSEKMFKEEILPLFDVAGISYNTVVTERQGHASDVVRSYDLYTIDGIVILSGDGLLYEVVNGLMGRADWERVIHIPIGILPTGSGNAICASTLFESGESFSLLNSALQVIRGGVGPMDLAVAYTPGNKYYFNLLIGWGLISDVDIESEKWRSIGEKRFVLGGLMAIARKKIYQGRLWYIPAEEAGTKIVNTRVSPYTTEDENSELGTENGSTKGKDQDKNEIKGAEENKTLDGPKTMYLQDLSKPLPGCWKFVDGEFLLMAISLVPYAAHNFKVAPTAQVGKGIFHISYVPGSANRTQLIGMMLKMSDGIIDHPACISLKAKAFRLEPITTPGLLTLDGEVIDYNTLQCEPFPGLCRVMTRKRQSSIT